MKLRLLFIISILFSVFEMQAQIPIYVNKAATGTNVGTSWANAYTSLEDAILAYSAGKEIWVAAETYKPYLPARNQTFLMRNGVKLYGGFNGTETLLAQRNPKINITTLSGDVSGNDNATIHSAEATRQDNLYHVISVRGNVQNVIIDGFTISGGNANGATLTSGAAASQYYHTRGGAIYINPYANGDNPTVFVTNCIFEKNSGSDVSTVTSYYASGVLSLSYTANFDLCIFRNNFSEMNAQILYGGYGPYFWFATGKITNCLFNNNTSALGVSCLYLSASATGGTSNGLNIDIINTTFASNVGASGNVIKAENAQTVRFKNSIIYNNGSLTPFSIIGSVFPVLQNTISQNGQLGGWSTNPLLSATFELQAGSLAIDSGSNVDLPVGTTTDLFGNNRIYNTTVDLGCYEYGSSLGGNDFSSFLDFSVYPNPSYGIINIESKETIETIDILSLEGRKVKSSNETKINISELSKGMYIMQVKTESGKMGIRRIIKN